MGNNVSHPSAAPEALTLPFPHHLENFMYVQTQSLQALRVLLYFKALSLSRIVRKLRLDRRRPFQYTQQFNIEVGKTPHK